MQPGALEFSGNRPGTVKFSSAFRLGLALLLTLAHTLGLAHNFLQFLSQQFS